MAIFLKLKSTTGFSIIEGMIAIGVLSGVVLVSGQFFTNSLRQSTQIRRTSARTTFEQELVALYTHINLCTCNMGGATPLTVPTAGSVAVPGLRSSCPAAFNDFYQRSAPGFLLDPSLSVESMNILNATLISGTSYSAILNIKYKAPSNGNIALRDGNFLLLFDQAAGPPVTISTCYVAGPVSGPSGSGWQITGNSGLMPTNFMGTIDDTDVMFSRKSLVSGLLATSNTSWGVNALVVTNVNTLQNTAIGTSALEMGANAVANTAVGFDALLSAGGSGYSSAFGSMALAANTANQSTAFGSYALSSNTTGSQNTAVGAQALQNNTTGTGSVAVGSSALQLSTLGKANTAIGAQSLMNNTVGQSNTAMGYLSLSANTIGGSNSAMGAYSMNFNTNGSNNSAAGYQALASNTTGNSNSVLGSMGMKLNISGNKNSAGGYQALMNNTTGSANSAFGANALFSNQTGSNNTAVGFQALQSSTTLDNAAFGSNALANNSIGTSNTAIGANSQQYNTTGSSNTSVGEEALYENDFGSRNVSVGGQTLFWTTGSDNTVVGAQAAEVQHVFSNNIAIGAWALLNNNTAANTIAIGFSTLNMFNPVGNDIAVGNFAGGGGSDNVAFGNEALYMGMAATQNTAFGHYTMHSSMNASQNLAIGSQSLTFIGGGSRNVGIGYFSFNSLNASNSNTAIGSEAGYGDTSGTHALTSGSFNTFIGGQTGVNSSGSTYNNSTAIGYGALVGHSNVMVLGAAGVSVGIGVPIPLSQLQLSIDSAAKSGTATWYNSSDIRLKDLRAPYETSFAAINKIQPIYFAYKKTNPLGLPTDKEFVGVVAQDVGAAIPESVKTNRDGYLFVKLDAVIWAMVNSIKELYHASLGDLLSLTAGLQTIEADHVEMRKKNDRIKSAHVEAKLYFCSQYPSAKMCQL